MVRPDPKIAELLDDLGFIILNEPRQTCDCCGIPKLDVGSSATNWNRRAGQRCYHCRNTCTPPTNTQMKGIHIP